MEDATRNSGARTAFPFRSSSKQRVMSAMQTELEALRRERNVLADERVPALQAELEALRREKNVLADEHVPALEAKLEVLRREKKMLADERIPALQAELEALRYEKNVLAWERVPALQTAFEALTHEKNVLAWERVPALQTALEALTHKLEALRHENDVLANERIIRGEELVLARSELDRLKAQLEEAYYQLYAANSSFQRAVSRNDELMRTQSDQLSAVTCSQRETERLRTELDTLKVRTVELERAAERGREHDEELIASRAHTASLIEISHELKTRLSNVAIAQDVARQLNDARDRISSRLELITSEISDIRRNGERGNSGAFSEARRLYLDLLESALTGSLTRDVDMTPWGAGEYDSDRRLYGRDWPKFARTMIGTARMRNLRRLVESVVDEGIDGDLLEAGVWRGGACIYMRGILAAHGVVDKTVWVADSFAGLPVPDAARYPADRDDPHHTYKELAVPLEEVKEGFEQFGLLDRQVAFLPGWFKDTLPGAPVERLAVLRLDGDMYGSTIEALEALYPRVSQGGYVIIDDYILVACKKAVDDFREKRSIIEPLVDVDGAAAYWRKCK